MLKALLLCSVRQVPVDVIGPGEVGFLSAHIKQVADARVGDTITSVDRPAPKQLEGYEEARPMVFCGLFLSDSDDYEDLRDALEKLQLNDSALTCALPATPLPGGDGD